MFKKDLIEYEEDKDYFHGVRLEKIYHCLDVGLRGNEAILEFRVGRMKFPDDVKSVFIESIEKLIKKA